MANSPVVSTPKGVRLAPSSTFIQPSVVHKKQAEMISSSINLANSSIEEDLIIDESHNIEMCEVFVIIGADDAAVGKPKLIVISFR